VNVVREVAELPNVDRAVAIGSFDGVHLGHLRVLAELARGPRPTVITFDPHPRRVLGYRVELLTTVQRRLELLESAGVEDVIRYTFTSETARTTPEQWVHEVLEPIGTRLVVAGPGFHFGHRREGELALLERLGIATREVEPLPGISSTEIRHLVQHGDVVGAAPLLGRPVEVEGIVVSGDSRGGTLGFPTANLDVDPELLVPSYGIYAGAANGRRAAISIGTNPHYGGDERRVEAFLLDFEGDLYGRRLIVELWRRLRDERAFESEQELIDQIAQDVEETRAAVRPV
jgi:riboflavin kinase/FMN adenylyltransferase